VISLNGKQILYGHQVFKVKKFFMSKNNYASQLRLWRVLLIFVGTIPFDFGFAKTAHAQWKNISQCFVTYYDIIVEFRFLLASSVRKTLKGCDISPPKELANITIDAVSGRQTKC